MPGFDYEITAHITNNSTYFQSVGLILRPTGPQAIVVQDLQISLSWLDGGRLVAAVPYRLLTIHGTTGALESVCDFEYVPPTLEDRTVFDLAHLTEVVPPAMRSVEPDWRQLAFSLEFSQPGCACIPKSVDRIVLEVDFAVGIGSETRAISCTVVLRPTHETSTEFYNFKSGAWSSHKCD